MPLPKLGAFDVTTTMRIANEGRVRFGRENPNIATSVALTDVERGLSLSFGQGEGMPVAPQVGFGLASDYDARQGGVNPVLGFASGGAFARAAVTVAPGLSLAVGASEHRRDRERDLTDFAARGDLGARAALSPLAAYRASAANVTVDYQVAKPLKLNLGYTRLSEPNAMLGVRSIEASDFGAGSTTEAMTMGATLETGDFTFAGSVSRSRSRSDARNRLTAGGAGLDGSAWQIAVGKARVLGTNDRLRLSVAKPLSIDSGTLDFAQVGIVDRETGARGIVTDTIDVTGPRRLVGEALYGMTMLGGQAELGAFGRADLGSRDEAGRRGFAVGLRTMVAF